MEVCGIAAASLAVTAVSTLFSIQQGAAQAKAQRQMYDHQARVREAEGALRREDRARNMARQIGEIRNAYGASGVALDGTPTDMIANTAGEFAREQYNDDFNIKHQTGALDTMANNSTYSWGPALFNLGAQGLNYAAHRANRGGSEKG